MAKIDDIITINIDPTSFVGSTEKSTSKWEGWDWNRTISKPKKRSMKDALPVAGRSFAEYIAYRLTKDGLGFVPIQQYTEASTIPGSHITSVIPQNTGEILVYFHELGHNKSKQPERMSRGFFSQISTCNGTIDCEYNAWVWALKYFRRLGYSLDQACRELIQDAFTSYLNNASDKHHARFRASQLSKLVGIDMHVKEDPRRNISDFVNVTITPEFGKGWSEYFGPRTSVTSVWFDEFSKYPAPKKEKPEVIKPKHWKPWHDMKNNQMKKKWRNAK